VFLSDEGRDGFLAYLLVLEEVLQKAAEALETPALANNLSMGTLNSAPATG
jgi:hypothetical protein